MMLDGIATGLAALTYASCTVVALFAMEKILFIGLHLSQRRKGLAAEKALLARPLPGDGQLPDVVVQLPVYNEGKIVERAVAAAAALDWPKDKLHIQVCDDSTDDTTRHARAAIEALAGSGLDISIVRRTGRDGYKAGSLQAAVERVPYQYFAILDADYLPDPSFLRQAMTVLLPEPKLAFVQCRPAFLNRDENILTRTQAIELDAHYGFEQTTRSWAGLPLPFNGTGGIWRRAAIEAGGGWQGKTLAEDMELSYAAWLNGWRGIFLATVAVPGELPADWKSWVSQQDRWLTGSAQVVRSVLPAIWRSRQFGWMQKIVSAAAIASWWLGPAINLMYASAACAVLLRPSLAATILPAVAVTLLSLVVIQFIELRLGHVLLRGDSRDLSAFLRDFVFYILCTLYKLWLQLFSSFRAFFRREPEFVRTPKRGIEKPHS